MDYRYGYSYKGKMRHKRKPAKWRTRKSTFGFKDFDWDAYAKLRAIPLEL